MERSLNNDVTLNYIDISYFKPFDLLLQLLIIIHELTYVICI